MQTKILNKLKESNEYIKNNKDTVDNTYRQKYHVMPEIGWMNDPNGFSYYKGEYHLFYQFYPYDAIWGPMHWAHAKSKDLVNWKHMDVALAPDQEYDRSGCFSGSAIEKDDKLYLMYTGHVDNGNFEELRQTQCVAVSEDGVNFNKYEFNPVIKTADLPENAKLQDFRDPKVYKKGDKYYVVVGSRTIEDMGQILLYSSMDMLKWKYEGVIAASNGDLGDMWECPDLFELGGKDVLIMSPQNVEAQGNRFWNLHSNSYMVGELDYETPKLNIEYTDEIDCGFDFYAPQTLVDDKGRRIMIAWMQMWERVFPTQKNGHKWAGCTTLPRELTLVSGRLYQKPVDELREYRRNMVSYSNLVLKGSNYLEGIEGQCIELDVDIDMTNSKDFSIKLMQGNDEEVVINYNKISEEFTFDRSKNGQDLGGSEKGIKTYRKTEVSLVDNKLKLNIFIDRISVEIFINDGIKTMTSTVYPQETSKDIEIICSGEAIVNINKWDIEVR